MKTQFLLLALALPIWAHTQETVRQPKHAVAVNAEGFFFSGSPYLATMSMQGFKYDYLFKPPEPFKATYLSTGLLWVLSDSESSFALPAEICIASNLGNIVSIHVGFGGIVHTSAEYLQPAILFTFHGKLRFKFGQLPIFLDLESRFFSSYRYSGSRGTRDGVALSPGLGLSLGGYLY